MKILKSKVLLLAVFCAVLSLQSCKDDSEDLTPNCPDGYSGINCEIFDDSEVQGLLDGGKTPKELIDDNFPISSLYGKMYEGGLIFYFNPSDSSGMVAAPTDQSLEIAWGCSGQIINGADGEGLGTGAQNTLDILAGCNTDGIAAKICADLELNGYSDWFLPSKDELNLMWMNLVDYEGNLGGFAASFYPSSTELSDQSIWVQFFSNGNQISDFKSNLHPVRAVRVF